MSDSPPTTAPPPLPPPPRSLWMVFEENQTWAVPQRPKFVIEGGSQEEVEELIRFIPQPSRDTRLTVRPIASFSDVAHYLACELAALEAQQARRFRTSFLNQL